jgi:hypothetical protein
MFVTVLAVLTNNRDSTLLTKEHVSHCTNLKAEADRTETKTDTFASVLRGIRSRFQISV